MTDPAAYVRTVLDAAGIQPSDAEVDVLASVWQDIHARIERLWQIDIGEDPPAAVFRAGE